MVTLKDTPWFVAADVCKALAIINGPHALQNIASNEVQDFRVPGTRGRPHKVVTEAGLYTLVMRSDKPEAKAFQAWVTGTVLPSIRKDGG